MGAEQEARPRPLTLSAVTAAASHLQDVDHCGHMHRGSNPPKKITNMEMSQLQEHFCFCISEIRVNNRLLSVSQNPKEKAKSDLFIVGQLQLYSNSDPVTARRVRRRHPGNYGFICLFKRHLSSGTTITEITGTGGEYCLVGVQFAVSTRLARFITN